jgi:hypothetical protein
MSILNVFKSRQQRYYENAMKSGASHQEAKYRARRAKAKMNQTSGEIYSWTGNNEAAAKAEGGHVRHYL